MIDRGDGWRRHADEQRRAWRRLSYAQRLQWLEQAKRFQSQALGLARRERVPVQAAAEPDEDLT
jgi:hypothetical protein